MALLCLALALFPSLFAWRSGAGCARFGRAALLLAPVAWVATEILRAHTLFHFSWCLLGYSQQRERPVHPDRALRRGLRRLVRGRGVLGRARVPGAREGSAGARARRVRHRLAVLLLAVGAARRRGALAQPIRPTGRMRVGPGAGVDPAGREVGPAAAPGRNVDRHIALTAQAADAGRAPRGLAGVGGALPLRPQPARGRAAAPTWRQARGIHLLFGNDDREDGTRGRASACSSGAKMLDPDGRARPALPQDPAGALRGVRADAAAADARRPLRGQARATRSADFTPGRRARDGSGRRPPDRRVHLLRGDLPRPGARLRGRRRRAAGQHHERRLVRAHLGAATSTWPWPRSARWRTGSYLVRAANTGISAVVDPRGRVLERTALFEPTVLVRDVPFLAGHHLLRAPRRRVRLELPGGGVGRPATVSGGLSARCRIESTEGYADDR